MPLFAVVGHPISHSKSPVIHSLFAKAEGIDLRYVAIDAPVDALAQRLDALRREGALGANITLPFKEEAARYATTVSPRVEAAGAANALKFQGDSVAAENFDGIGLVRDVTINQGLTLRGRRVLVLGAGGASRGILLPLLEQDPAEVVIANRDVDKAKRLTTLAPGLIATSYEGLQGQSFDVVFNATAASLSSTLPPLPEGLFAANSLAYDLVYGKGETPFLTLARRGGAKHLMDGLGMLVEQAAESFAWWLGPRPATAAVIAQLEARG